MLRKKKVVLEVSNPIISTYPHHANILAILQNNEYEMPLLLNNYIQLVFDRRIERMDFSIALDIIAFYKNLPLLYSHSVDRSFIKNNWNGVVDFAKKSINNSYYIHCLVDTYYISAYETCFERIHSYHNIFIYGYDDEEKKIYVGDSFVNGHYKFTTITYRELENSFFDNYINDWLDGILLFKFKEDPYVGVGYDAVHIKKEINNYLLGSESECITIRECVRRNNVDFYYGIAIYEQLKDYLKQRIENADECDVRIFCVLLDHKRIIKYICENLEVRTQLSNPKKNIKNFEELESLCNVIVQKVLKYNIKCDVDIIDEILEHIDEVSEKDKKYMEQLSNSFLINAFDFNNTKVTYVNSSECSFVDIINNGYGNWQGKFGKEGYEIVGFKKNLPQYVARNEYIYINSVYVLIFRTTGNDAALHLPENKSNRIVAYLLSGEEFKISININSDISKMLTAYCVDYDQLNRSFSIEVLNTDTGEVIDRRVVEHFEKGTYIRYRAKGQVVLRFRKISGPDVCISGLFFDE